MLVAPLGGVDTYPVAELKQQGELMLFGHLEKYRFHLEAPIETHVLVGVSLVQSSL